MISFYTLTLAFRSVAAGSGASLSCGSMTLSGSLSPTIPPDGGPQTVPTATNQPQQTPADVHEPATTSSDITSIASQSPPHDTGQKPHYPSTFTTKRFTEKLTNTTSTNDKDDKFRSNIAKQTKPLERDFEHRDVPYDYDYDTENVFTEFRFPMVQKTVRARVEKENRDTNFDDPDILKDLGKPVRDDFGWQRSASCKELGMLYRQERLLKADTAQEAEKDDAAKFDSYRYCYSCHGQTPTFDKNNRDQRSTEMKVYSSSYPGTTPRTSVESDDEPIASGGVFIMDKENKDDYQKISQDDLSHDSYEILEKETAFRSRSSSVESDEMFVMENDYKSISKHILWREGSADVEKRLGYVEPRYRNIGFNEFNEICKRGFASRNRDASQSHGNIKFSEFGTKPCFNAKLTQHIGHDSVARTKSDPYMLNKQKSTNKQKLYGLHQKSFELPPTEFNDVIEDDRFSKSTVDIPYTLRIRNAMNGTARDPDSNYDDSCIYENISNLRSKSEEGGLGDAKNKSHASDHASQDSGLSLSLGMESVDDNDIDLKNILMTKSNHEQVVTTKKSTKLMLSLSEENNESVPSEEPSPRVQDENKTLEGSLSNKKEKEAKPKTKLTLSAEDAAGGEKHITKVKSMEVPKKSTHSCKIRKSRSAETYDRKSSFLRTDSTGSRGKKEIIVIDSDDYHSFDDSRSDKRSDGSDSVIIVEYRGNRKKKLSKKASSDSRGSQAESEASSFDAPRIKKKDLRKRNSAQGYFSKDRIPTIEISEDETYKGDGSSLATLRPRYQYEYSSDERQASGSDLSKTEVINEIAEDTNKEQRLESPMTEDEMEKEELVVDKAGKNAETSSPVKLETTNQSPKNEPVEPPKKQEKSDVTHTFTSPKKGEKSPILTRLGLSEGSAISQITQNTLSPSAARRAKSLDTPIVSLHRLPPITSFSSKDDTVDNEEGVVLEEKTLKQVKNKLLTVTESVPEEKQKPESTEPDLIPKKEDSPQKVVRKEKPEIASKPPTGKDKLSVGNENRIPLSKELKRNSIAVATMWKQSLDIKSQKKSENGDMPGMSKERSKSEGYEKNLSKECLTPDRKHSTRQERLDSFKKLKNFSIELWESDDVEASKKKLVTSTSKEYDDVFDDETKCSKSPKSSKIVEPIKEEKSTPEKVEETVPLPKNEPIASEIDLKPLPICEVQPQVTNEPKIDPIPEPETESEIKIQQNDELKPQPVTPLTPTESSGRKSLKLDFQGAFTPEQIQEMEIIQGLLNASPTTAEAKGIPEKRSFDEEPSSSSSIKPEPLKPYPLESSGSSSVEEAILPPDYIDDEELPDVTTVNLNFDSSLGKMPGAMSTSFGAGFFSLSRTLSRISERSTTSEQERTDYDEDSTKPLSRSLSIDDSIISSDQHPSFSSDPPSGMNLENVFDEDDAAAELEDDKLDFNIPPPLLSGDEEWPSPPHSASSAKTPVIDNERYSAPLPQSPQKSDEESISEDNKTLQDEEVSDHEDKVVFLKEMEKPRGSIGDDTSAGITTSDWSSSTGTTIKQAHSVGPSYGSKSEDNSLAGEYGMSMSTDMASESRKSSTDDLAPIPLEKKYLTLDRKQTSFERRQIFFPPSFRSFEDEYDSPYTESEDTPSSPLPPHVLRKPPPPPRHFQTAEVSPNGNQKPRTKMERNRAAKFLPHYTSSSMSTSLESPTNAERKFAKSVAKAKCYSYYSLARSPPSDGSSSSPDAPETPLTPNTIPRVSKRRRNPHTMRRRQQRTDSHIKGVDYSTSPSSAHTPHTPKQFHYPPRRSRH